MVKIRFLTNLGKNILLALLLVNNKSVSNFLKDESLVHTFDTLPSLFVLTGFDVAKTGDARIGFVGFPSVGKSTLLSNLAGVYSEVAAYEFTTLTTVPGVIKYKGAKIQLLDLPGIIEGAKDGKGRGKQVIAGALMIYMKQCSSF